MRRVLEIDRAMPHETEFLEALRTVSRRLSLLLCLCYSRTYLNVTSELSRTEKRGSNVYESRKSPIYPTI
jgi:hypothetical protein